LAKIPDNSCIVDLHPVKRDKSWWINAASKQLRD